MNSFELFLLVTYMRRIDNIMTITSGQRIKDIRQSLFLKQAEFAMILQVSHQSVSNVETGNRKFGLRVLKKIEQLCKEHKIEFNLKDFLK